MATAPSPSRQEETKFSQICGNCKVRAAAATSHAENPEPLHRLPWPSSVTRVEPPRWNQPDGTQLCSSGFELDPTSDDHTRLERLYISTSPSFSLFMSSQLFP
jgi:hypothetical protein